MPTSLTITCSNCGQIISVDEALTHQLQEELKKDLLSETSVQTTKRIKEAEEAARLLATQEFKAWQKESLKRLQLLESENEEKDKKLQQMADKELKLRKEKNELEESRRQQALEVQRQVDEQRQELRNAVVKEFEEKTHFDAAQKDKQLDDMRKKLAEAQRVAQQGSQQSQGEVVELELESILIRLFPLDSIEPVAKGVYGADVVHVVCDRLGNRCGTIVWELKNTKAWSPSWIIKLKEDQRQQKAEVAVIISTVLPDGIKEFGNVDGVWVANFSCVAGLATVLRSVLLEVASARSQGENKQEKMEVLYGYLTGVSFSQRVQSVVEAFNEMQSSLQKEKVMYTRHWAAREKQLERALLGMSGMWGDFEGLMGPALPKMEALGLEAGKMDVIESAEITEIE